MEPAWIAWIRDISDHAPDRQVAAKIGIAPSTVGRWQDYPPKIDAVVKLARAYGVPVADGLLASGYVQPGDLRTPRYERDLGRFTASELLAELAQRVTPDGQQLHAQITSPNDYGEEPDPNAYDLAAGHVARPDAPR
ncbi:helix-turn-helix domain-containing protein [Brachybacterium tyrofermentans]|uniref:helix-turn-helix domain-containing protein n=1 Tax=Brachybacterium tyrofermentans TaxID=47848 RepID=UPI0018679F33|nr:helix-turn-helix transcriptional regulator [Brachybacterium tyrofermentans]